MVSELRWPDDPCPETGIDVRSLELDPGDLAVLDILRRPDVMAHLAQWNAGTALGEDTRRRVVASCAVAVISVPGGALTDYARGDLLPRWYGLPHSSGGRLYNPSHQSSCTPAMSRISPNCQRPSLMSWAICRKNPSSWSRYRPSLPLPWCCDLLSVTRLRCGAIAILAASI